MAHVNRPNERRNELSGRITVAAPEKRTYEGILFQSAHEMEAYRGFRALEKSGAIRKLERQVPFALYAYVPGDYDQNLVQYRSPIQKQVSKYVADFVITELDGTVRIYDSKAWDVRKQKFVYTEMYTLKKKWMMACHPHLRIVEI